MITNRHCLSFRTAIAIAGLCSATLQASVQADATINWTPVGGANWHVAGTEISASTDGNAGYLVSQEAFGDFSLHLEFRPDASVNSGVFLRCQDREAITPINCYEINIWDAHPNQDFRTGAIVTRAFPPLAKVDTAGKWNRFEIRAVGGKISVLLNGVKTAELEDDSLDKGFIALQCAATGSVEFRNISLKIAGKAKVTSVQTLEAPASAAPAGRAARPARRAPRS